MIKHALHYSEQLLIQDLQSFPFGWEDSANGFRGHLFMSLDNSTIVLAIKGTTVQGATSKKDKFNDNLLFSCCCAWVDITWVFATVCNCFSLDWKCDNKCLTNALVKDSLFYSVGVVRVHLYKSISSIYSRIPQNLFKNVTELYPNANIWLTGHSLGGALASLIGTTFGVPAVAFESPGERLAAQRLHLPSPPLSPVTHVYHTADPIPQGTCTGIGSTCAQAGYALETRCHLGKSIIYDTISRYGWRVDVRKHIIKEVITTVLDDPNDWGEGREVPLATSEEDCVVGFDPCICSCRLTTQPNLRIVTNGSSVTSRSHQGVASINIPDMLYIRNRNVYPTKQMYYTALHSCGRCV